MGEARARLEEDGRTLVRDVNTLWRHGFIWETDKSKHVLSRDDFEILLALRALNAKITDEGVITSQVYPSVLNYLREKEKIEETEAAHEIKIHDEPLPRARAPNITLPRARKSRIFAVHHEPERHTN